MRIHYLQHVSFENPGSILEWAKANNGLVTSTQLYNDEGLPDVNEFDWLVVMGGPMNIYEEAFRGNIQYGYATAKSTVLFIIVLLITAVQLSVMRRREEEL